MVRPTMHEGSAETPLRQHDRSSSLALLASDISKELDPPRNRFAHEFWDLVLGEDSGGQRTSYNLVGFQGLMQVEDPPRALMYLVHELIQFRRAVMV